MRVDRIAQRVRTNVRIKINMRNLSHSMHTGICAARTIDTHILTAKAFNAGLQHVLHRAATGL